MTKPERWVPFDENRTVEAARLLVSVRNDACGLVTARDTYSEDVALVGIEAELAKDVSSALMLLDGDSFAGFAIATVSDDPVWGRSGWLAPGAFAMLPGYDSALPDLYARIGQDWLNHQIDDHRVFALASAPGGGFSDTWYEMGFAKQQTYAVLDDKGMRAPNAHAGSPDLVIRRAEGRDRAAITTFSRCIALFQAEGPCFAAAPEAHLRALDEGFAELLDDEDYELFVADDGGNLVGIAVLCPATRPDLLAPSGSVELRVAAVKADYRGSGVGTVLARAVFSYQAEHGRTCVMTDWRCANPLSSRFWITMGFQPVAHRLVRRLHPLCLSRSP